MTAPAAARKAKFGDFVADFDSFELRKYGIRLKLQHQPFRILRLLLQRPGQLVTREELRMELWTESTFVDFDAGLNAGIRRLRDALNDFADEPRYIETLPRLGYRFIAPVEVVAAPLPTVCDQVAEAAWGNGHGQQGPAVPPGAASAELGSTPATAQPNPWRVPRLWKLVAACVLVVALGMGAVAMRSRVFGKRSGDGRLYSIAVLPLQNLSGDPSQDYFADGMTDALITNLAQSGSLQVISNTSSNRYKASENKPLPSIREIGQELNASVIVEGTVIRSGNHMRVTVQLIDAAKDQHLWARRYDRDLKDVLQLQSELASAIAEEVAGRLTPPEQSRLAAHTRTVNPQAYEALLKGHYFLDKWTVEGLEKAKAYFQQSIDLDPNYADAYSGLAEYYATVAFLSVTPQQEAWLKAEDLLAKTLEMDGTSSNAHSLLGMIKMQFRCDRPAAEKELNRALELNPGDMVALYWHSYYLLEIGRTDEAIAEKKKVLERDPLSVRNSAELGLYLYHAGHYDEAISQLQKALEVDPNYAAAHMRLGWCYIKKQLYGQGVTEMQRATALDRKPMRLATLGVVYAHLGKRQEASEMIRQLREMSKQRYVPPAFIALIYAQLGEKESAIAWLQKIKPDDPKLDVDFEGLDALRSDQQLKKWMARLTPNPACPPF